MAPKETRNFSRVYVRPSRESPSESYGPRNCDHAIAASTALGGRRFVAAGCRLRPPEDSWNAAPTKRRPPGDAFPEMITLADTLSAECVGLELRPPDHRAAVRAVAELLRPLPAVLDWTKLLFTGLINSARALGNREANLRFVCHTCRTIGTRW